MNFFIKYMVIITLLVSCGTPKDYSVTGGHDSPNFIRGSVSDASAIGSNVILYEVITDSIITLTKQLEDISNRYEVALDTTEIDSNLEFSFKVEVDGEYSIKILNQDTSYIYYERSIQYKKSDGYIIDEIEKEIVSSLKVMLKISNEDDYESNDDYEDQKYEKDHDFSKYKIRIKSTPYYKKLQNEGWVYIKDIPIGEYVVEVLEVSDTGYIVIKSVQVSIEENENTIVEIEI